MYLGFVSVPSTSKAVLFLNQGNETSPDVSIRGEYANGIIVIYCHKGIERVNDELKNTLIEFRVYD